MYRNDKIKVYLKNVNSEAYTPVRQVLSEFLKEIEYTNNYRAYDLAIDCQYINKDNIKFHKANILKQIEDEINKRKRNPLRNYI